MFGDASLILHTRDCAMHHFYFKQQVPRASIPFVRHIFIHQQVHWFESWLCQIPLNFSISTCFWLINDDNSISTQATLFWRPIMIARPLKSRSWAAFDASETIQWRPTLISHSDVISFKCKQLDWPRSSCFVVANFCLVRLEAIYLEQGDKKTLFRLLFCGHDSLIKWRRRPLD